MRKELMRCLVACALATALLMCCLITGCTVVFSRAQLRTELTQWADMLSAQLDAAGDPVALLSGGVYAQRVTLVDSSGAVLFDSRHDASGMANHAGREEIDQAAQAGEGWAVRQSATLGETSIYYARRLASGAILRVAATQRSLLATVRGLLGWVLLGAAACVALAALIARPLTARLVRPLNEIDLDHPLNSDACEELAPMLRRMDQQNRRIAAQMDSLAAQRAQLNAVLDGMREGLAILDAHAHVLVMNPAARELLRVQADPVGQPLLAVSRHASLMALLRQGAGEGEMPCGARVLRISLSPVEGAGSVLLLQDVTEARQAEESRRQFSANVSHELRTPLTTISGYAEMLSSGMANPADAGALGEKILKESRRLLSLIEDILRLSRLDEGISREMRPVALSALAETCADKLRDLARRQGVTLTLRCQSAPVTGDASLLEEMITNLIENSIKYNRPSGTVTVETGQRDGHAYLTVRDTGVGIPPEHQSRVFERFYRVDKSRSKQTGGTGLGLSIVKHGAQLHHAAITLRSQVGQGTEITLTF